MRLLIIILLFSFFSIDVLSQEQNINIPWFPGEELKYSFGWGVLSLGRAEISFDTDHKNCETYIVASAKSSGFARFLKDIQYSFETCVQGNKGLPYSSARKVVEGSFHDYDIAYYYHDIREDSSIVYTKELDSVVVEKDIKDIITGFFFFRSNIVMSDLNDYKIDTITTFFIDSVWNLVIKYGGVETINTIHGPVECLKFYPETEVGSYFSEKDDMTLWISNDSRRIPYKIYVDLKVGSITAELQSYTPPKTSKVKKH
ncbi:MAG: DUF3108 domain-containing protein [Bacteroidales bacterium]|nr:DUF3108 domain-containing protein [Bacteroidales bacterium]MBN2819444.1 DUF3108 domain-containing protein [Bacteroidales bacterium]